MTDVMDNDISRANKIENIALASLEEQSLAVNMQRAELDQEIAAAKMCPRSPQAASERIQENALYDPQLAAECIYALPRGDKPIKGPSVRFAEIVRNAWGNCRVHARPVLINRSDKMVVAEAAFRDFESNVTTVATEERRISGRTGQIFSDDMILVTMKAACAIAKRNVILESVPRRFWKPVYDVIEKAVKGDITTFAENRDKALKAFADFGVKPERIFPIIGIKGGEDMTIEHIPLLRGMYTALKDGSATVEEMFDPRRRMAFAEDASPKLGERLKRKKGAAGFDAANVENGLKGAVEAQAEAAKTGEAEDAAAVKAAAPRKRKPRKAPARAKGGKEPAPMAAESQKEPAAASAAPRLVVRQSASKPPKAAEEYEPWVRAWVVELEPSQLRDRWNAEIDLRKRIGVGLKMREDIRRRIVEPRISEARE